MSFPHPLSQTFRYLEWIYIAAHFSMKFNDPTFNFPADGGVYGCFWLLSWFYPIDCPLGQRWSYISLGLLATLWARQIGIDLELFLFFYLSKSYFLLNRRITILIAILIGLIWTIVDYLAKADLIKSAASVQGALNSDHPSDYILFSLATYTAACAFVLMFSETVVKEQKSRQRANELAEQVESLATTLERTRIAREIHDSLGHMLTDLDMQLAVAQQLRFHNLEQAFQAIDMAKVLAHQCIEDVSHALNRMRQSDFDLNQALGALMEQINQSGVLDVEWDVNLPRLPAYQSYQIYCIVKEGMINVQKHARASQVNFQGGRTEKGLILDLKDNGIGFDPGRQQSGFGIQGMMERVQLLGGQFKLNTTLGKGTQIQIILPL